MVSQVFRRCEQRRADDAKRQLTHSRGSSEWSSSERTYPEGPIAHNEGICLESIGAQYWIQAL